MIKVQTVQRTGDETTHILLAKSFQSCPTLCGPVDCGPPASSVRRDSPGKNTGVVVLLQGIFQTQGPKPCLLCLLQWQASSLPLSPTLNGYVSWVAFGNIFCVCKLVSISIEMYYYITHISFFWLYWIFVAVPGAGWRCSALQHEIFL